MLRFVATPTKDINISNLRVAIFNYIVSKQLNENLIIRIEDDNLEKSYEGKDKDILEILNLFSIEYSNVVYQSSNLKYHQKIAMQLLSQKKAFSCFCGDEKLKELSEKAENEGKLFKYDDFCEKLSDQTVLNTNSPFTVRIKKPVNDTKNSFDIDSFVILKHDKTPTNNYACSIDDMIMDISTSIRESKYFDDAPKQIHIRESLGYEKKINYIHIPNILNSNSNNELSVKWLIDEGFLPSSIANYLVFLGNNTPSEIFTLEEAIEWFDIKNISKNEIKFDINELKIFNRKHLESIDELRLSKILGFADPDIGKLAKLFLKEVSTIKEIKEKIEAIFKEKSTYIGFEEEFKILKSCMKNAPYIEKFNELEVYIREKTNLNEEVLLKLLRYILTGFEDGPNISDIYPLIRNYMGEIIK